MIKKAVDSNGLANSQLSPKQNKRYRYLKKETNKIIIVIKMITLNIFGRTGCFYIKCKDGVI